MAKMGRPLKEINQEQFEKLCSLMCTEVEIAEYFNCSDDTVNAWCKRTYGMTFAETFKRKCSPGKSSLRRAQFELAMKGNAVMLIWLGKQFLGQTDKVFEIGSKQKTITLKYSIDKKPKEENEK